MSNDPKEHTIAVIGGFDAGKTTFIKTVRDAANGIIGLPAAEETPTLSIAEYNVTLPDGKTLTFLDTPGFDGYQAGSEGAKTTGEILQMLEEHLGVNGSRTVSHVLVFLNANNATTTELKGRARRAFERLFPNSKVVYVTTRWDQVENDDGLPVTVEEAKNKEESIYAGGKTSGSLLEYLHDNRENRGDVLRFRSGLLIDAYSSPHDIIQKLFATARQVLDTTLEASSVAMTGERDELDTKYNILLREKGTFLQEKEVFLQEKGMFFQEKEAFLQEKGVFFQEKQAFLQDKQVFLQEKGAFLQELKAIAEKGEQATETGTEALHAGMHCNLPEVLIAVMGATGSGKSTFINTACGTQELEVHSGLSSCTDEVQLSHPFVLDGCQVRLIDTPGFDDTTKSDTDILKMIAMFLSSAYDSGKTLAGVIYVHRISDHRMGGISRRNLRMFRRLCGDDPLKNVVIVTNKWNEVNEELGKRREHELRTQDTFFKPVLDYGAVMVRHNNSKESAHRILGYLIDKERTTLPEMSIEEKGIDETAAGEEINKVLIAQAKAHRKQMEELLQEHRDALQEKDEQAGREIEEARRMLEAKMKRNQLEAQKLADANFEKFRRAIEAARRR